ncbi:MAG TPA: tetratricopeptide repeat protein [Methylophaga aminisulfidivorans]|uniref:Tetratricopeptide repeat protein n=1 Tax=Methylophaga aminisulfidivorans TaxID=230105 RepID=A0A7C1ZUJ6_9GAMM|nr:tetratricopeptide repeat protein [Methylophaga aminisulfidivorans]HEC74569.1 tetratricopeptide repeat protein [Methylophaga aminisulfidivorans]
MKTLLISLIVSAFSLPAFAGVMEEVADLQTQWATVNYTLQDEEQQTAYENLVNKANEVVQTYPDRAESHIWRGIIESSFAGAKGGLGALSLAKAAKSDFEKAISIDDKAMNGSAYTSLGTLYFKVPGWPLGFGDDDKAEAMLRKALKINPQGIDSNYFYAQYLIEKKQYKSAELFLNKAKNAAPRPTRPLADKGRHAEIDQSLKLVMDKLGK